MGFTGSNTGLPSSYCFNEVDDSDITNLLFTEPCIVLIPGLATVSQEQADPGNRYFLGLFLCEDLPGRFFMTLIP